MNFDSPTLGNKFGQISDATAQIENYQLSSNIYSPLDEPFIGLPGGHIGYRYENPHC